MLLTMNCIVPSGRIELFARELTLAQSAHARAWLCLHADGIVRAVWEREHENDTKLVGIFIVCSAF